MTERCLVGVQKVFWAEGLRVSQKSVAPGKRGLRLCNPMLRQSNKPFAPMSANSALSKALRARSGDLTSVPGGLVCNPRGPFGTKNGA